MSARTQSMAALLVCLGTSIGAIAQNERPVYPASAAEVSYAALDELPDWRGIWQPFFGEVRGDDPQLKGAALEFYEAETAKVAADPSYEIPEKSSNCLPPGMPYMMTMPYSLEFLLTPGKIVVIQEALMQVRHIFTDGRPFPKDPDPSFFGESRGHWEGDTLVVETIGTQPGQRLGIRGITNGPHLKITERIYLDADNENILHLDFTYEDPDVLAAPWHQNYRFRRDRTWEILEYVCENDRHPVNAEGQTEAILSE
jgi:hypothetical protein